MPLCVHPLDVNMHSHFHMNYPLRWHMPHPMPPTPPMSLYLDVKLCAPHLQNSCTFSTVQITPNTREEKDMNVHLPAPNNAMEMEYSNATPTSIILKTVTTMSEMNDSIGIMTKNNPSAPNVPVTMTTTPTSSNPSAPTHDLDSAFNHIKAEKQFCPTHPQNSTFTKTFKKTKGAKPGTTNCLFIDAE